MAVAKPKGLRERLRNGETVLCAEGYLFELERRGFVKFGDFTPEVVLDYPERVLALHEEFVLAGSDTVLAYTYYGHRHKMQMIHRENECKTINLKSLKMARDVADKYGKLMAGNLSNTTMFQPDNEEIAEEVADIFREQVEWAVEGGADYMIGETFNDFQEAKLALEAIQKYGKGMPAVITLAAYCPDHTTDNVPLEEALRRLEELGADVVGLNCGRGPATMMPLLERARKVCQGPLAAIPVPLRTTEQMKTMQALQDPVIGDYLYPANLMNALCRRSEIQQFTKKAQELGIQYLGLCCCNSPCLFREMAISCDKNPALARFTPDLTSSFLYGDVSEHKKTIRDFMAGASVNVYTE